MGRGGGGGKRNNKAQYYRKSAAKKPRTDGGDEAGPSSTTSSATNLADNLQGVLVSCNYNEYQCLKDAYNILNEAADKLYGSGTQEDNGDDNDGKDVDIEASIQAEIATLKTSDARKFVQVKTKCNNVIFVRFNDDKIEPNRLVRGVFDSIREASKANTRYIQRFIPIMGTFKATDSEKSLEEDFRAIFTKFASKNIQTYSVMAKVRNNSAFKSESAMRSKMIEVIREERSNWSINHNEPKMMVVLNIVQKAGAVSILEDYNELSKYNLVLYGKKCEGVSNVDSSQGTSGVNGSKKDDSEATTAQEVEPEVTCNQSAVAARDSDDSAPEEVTSSTSEQENRRPTDDSKGPEVVSSSNDELPESILEEIENIIEEDKENDTNWEPSSSGPRGSDDDDVDDDDDE